MIKPRFDASLNWGHVLNAVAIFVTVTLATAGFYKAVSDDIRAVQTKAEIVQERLQLLDLRLGGVEKSINQMTTVIVTSAQLKERIRALEQRLDRAER